MTCKRRERSGEALRVRGCAVALTQLQLRCVWYGASTEYFQRANLLIFDGAMVHHSAAGSGSSGVFCCKWPATGHCAPPAGVPPQKACCLVPGEKEGCQNLARCGVNPSNHTACNIPRIALDLARMVRLFTFALVSTRILNFVACDENAMHDVPMRHDCSVIHDMHDP
jgi:hypothetical protein